MVLVALATAMAGACDGAPTGIESGGARAIVFETAKGTIRAEVYTGYTPLTAQNFITLVNAGFYDGLTFHRYVPGFIVQGGDPNGDGTGGSGTRIPLEIDSRITHVKGTLGMARGADLNSASSQFYITLDAAHHLDGSYAAFGRIIEDMDVVEQLRPGDRMLRVFVP